MYNTKTSKRDRIRAPGILNMDFRPVFIVNRYFLVKLKANPFGFLVET
jgi:hypothetical protein